MTYKVIQWATGGVGRAAIEYILAHPELELVGCWVSSEAKDGQDVGDIIGAERVGVTATRDVEALLALEADCVLYSPVMADRALVCRLLASGKNVVTPLGWFYPGERDVSDLAAACAPRFMRLRADFNVRGGLYTSVVAEHRTDGWQPLPPTHLPWKEPS